MAYHFINSEKIKSMLFHDNGYVIEFCEAGISSFEEFIHNYSRYLLARNIQHLRKAGHKIRPGAQMMGVEEVVEEYEQAKELLKQDAEEEALVKSVNKMNTICTSVQEELSHLAQTLK